MARISSAAKSVELSPSKTQTSLVPTLTRPSSLAAAGTLAPVVRPQTAGAFRPRKVEPTRFRYFYDRGDLPVRVNFAGAVRKLQWQVDLSLLDYSHYLPVFMEGLRELEEPYHFLALNGTLDMLEKGGSRVLPCLSLLVLPMKANLMTRNQTVLCLQMKVLQRLVLSCPYTGEALVPYYRQLLSIFNLFITKRVNCGDAIDYAQRRQENVGDLILETLNILEKHGGPDAFVNIKYMIPTYESCMTRH
ncbi:Mitogen-activated protein kinase kinase 5 [Phytophthora boehmeriae]|uniref:Mitogen-activated protein kinase kinase 5 n=1 Tax=Phytophthora boehmeriae TaxID=109152 RepID=A0A8T1X6H0_9STRA|nr:Mitogen-activated protein kinase kinase 5 [Phytophthora boehmeriae]